MKITAFGKVGEIGSASGKPVSVVAARFNQPSGITVIECDDKEHAVVADTGNHALRVITNVTSLRHKKKVLTLRKTNVKDSDFKQPRALATKEGKEVFAGTCYGHSIYLFDISIKDSTATCILKLQIKEIITVMGLTFQSDTGELYVANRRNLLIVRFRKLP